MAAEADRIRHAVVGIGININVPMKALPVELQKRQPLYGQKQDVLLIALFGFAPSWKSSKGTILLPARMVLPKF